MKITLQNKNTFGIHPKHIASEQPAGPGSSRTTFIVLSSMAKPYVRVNFGHLSES